jgi:hypothetical protein
MSQLFDLTEWPSAGSGTQARPPAWRGSTSASLCLPDGIVTLSHGADISPRPTALKQRGIFMAKKKKAKRAPKRSPKKAKAAAKRGKATRKAARKRAAAKPKKKKRAAAKKQPVAKAAEILPPLETVIVDTVEEPSPGVVVVTEYEATVQWRKPGR